MIRDILFLLFILGCLWIVLKGLSKYQVPVHLISIKQMIKKMNVAPLKS